MIKTQRGRVTAALIATAAIGATAGVWMHASTRIPSAIDALVAARRSEQTIDARLSASFLWVPSAFPTPHRAKSKSLQRVMAETHGRLDPVSLHAAGVAHLLAGHDQVALTLLRRASREHPTTQTANDHAAALITASIAEDRPDLLVEALAAADQALDLDRRFPPALFNRAVVIERLYLRTQAEKAWSEYLAVDADSQWAAEARRRRNHSAPTRTKPARARQRLAEIAFRNGDRESLQRFVDDFRGYSYRFTEGPTLCDWAEASARGDEAEAEQKLAFARAVGKESSELTGDRFLSDTVGFIDASTGTVRKNLIEGYVAYGKGRRALARGSISEANSLLNSAKASFRSAGSPMSYAAEAWGAQALFAHGRGTEARKIVRVLRSTETAARYPTFRAMLQSHLGTSEMSDGYWSAALVALQQAATSYAALGDRAAEARVHNAIATAYASVGNRRLAWQERMVALRMDPEDLANEGVATIAQAARYETLANRPHVGLSLLELAAGRIDAPYNPWPLFEVHRARASMWTRRGDHQRAFAALEQARKVASQSPHANVTRWLNVTEAEVIAATDPLRALQLLDSARSAPSLEPFERGELIPQLELQRARVLRRLARPEEAIDALRSGIEAVANRRTFVIEEEMRTSVLDFAEPLFRELVDILASTGATEAAFDYADRWRARTLLDSLAIDQTPSRSDTPILPLVRTALPPKTAILEYVILENRLLIFCVTGNGLDLFTVPISKDHLRDTVDTFATSIQSRTAIESLTPSSTAVYDILIRPAELALSNVSTIVFVPDLFLQRVAFAALYDDERFLIEKSSLAVSPSAQLVVALGYRAPRTATRDVLVIGNPDTHGALGKLDAAERESRLVASLYPLRSIALGPEATRDRFLSEWGMSRVVHFAGHAANARANAVTTSLALSGYEDASFVSVHDIMQLSPVTVADEEASLFLDPEPPATRLVVLAACETFAGRDEHLEGTPTLAHAFLAAGVPSVVGALWKIEDDDAHTLFTTFHRHVANGVPVGKALRQAQIAMLYGNDEGQRHPSSWAGITLAGVPTLTISSATIEARKQRVADLH
jgi:CHAT domain-containing protein